MAALEQPRCPEMSSPGSSWQEGHVMLTPPLCGFSVPCHQFGPALSRSEQISVRPMAGKKGVWGSRDCWHIGERGLRTVRQVDRRGAGRRGPEGGWQLPPACPFPSPGWLRAPGASPSFRPCTWSLESFEEKSQRMKRRDVRAGGPVQPQLETLSRLNTEKANQPTNQQSVSLGIPERTQTEKLRSNCHRADCLKEEKHTQVC